MPTATESRNAVFITDQGSRWVSRSRALRTRPELGRWTGGGVGATSWRCAAGGGAGWLGWRTGGTRPSRGGVVGLAVVGLAVVGLAVVGLAVVGLACTD